MIPPLEESKQYLRLFYFQEKFPNVQKKMNYHAQDLCEKGDSFGFDKRYCLYSKCLTKKPFTIFDLLSTFRVKQDLSANKFEINLLYCKQCCLL